jgi:hypothetical protein
MTTKLTLDKAGRVMIPKSLRPKALLRKERGVSVYQGEPTDASVTALIDSVRVNRLRELNKLR